MAMRREHYADVFLQLLANLEVVSFKQYDNWAPQYQRVYREMDTTKPFINMTGISDLGLPASRIEGGPATFDRFYQLFDKRFDVESFSLGVDMTRETMDDDMFGIFARAGESLAMSFRLGDEVLAAEILDNSHLTTQDRYKSADGSAIHSTSHPINQGAATASNRLSSNADLAMSSLEALVLLIEDTPNDRGNQIMAEATRLVIPSELQFVATRLLDSPMDPETAENSVSPIRRQSIGLDLQRYLQDPDSYFLWADRLANSDVHLAFIRRQAFDLDSDVDIKTQSAFMVATDRKVLGAHNWRGSAKSTGGVAP